HKRSVRSVARTVQIWDWMAASPRRMSVARAHDMARQSADPSIRLAGEHSMQANLRRALVAVALLAPPPPAVAAVNADWNEKAVAFVTPRMTPPAAQRVVAMVQVAMFDAVNSIERRYRPYLVQLPAPAAASKEAAAAAAAGSVLAGLHPQAQAELK